MTTTTAKPAIPMVAVDQYGQCYHIPGQHPRKELLAELGRKRASKMYVDSRSRGTLHIGYVIGGHWLTLYQRVENKA